MWTYFSISAFAWGQASSKLGGVDTSILHHAFISIFIALWAVITRYVTILMPILSYFYKVYMKRENAGSWNSGLEKEQILETYSAQLQKSWNSTKVIFGINKKYWEEEVLEGGHPPSTRVGARPPTSWALWQPSGDHLLLYEVFYPRKKIISKLSGRNTAATRRSLGGTNLGLRRSCSAGETSLREGEILTIVITNDPLIGRGSMSINMFTSTIPSQTLVHLLYTIFV